MSIVSWAQINEGDWVEIGSEWVQVREVVHDRGVTSFLGAGTAFVMKSTNVVRVLDKGEKLPVPKRLRAVE